MTSTRRPVPDHRPPVADLDSEIETIFRKTCERLKPLLREKLRTPMKTTTINGVECDTAKDTLLGTEFSAFEGAAAYLARSGEFYVRAVSPISDGIIAFEKSEIEAISNLLAHWFFQPFPTFPALVAFAGEHSGDHVIGEIAWLSLDDYSKPWPEWLKVVVKNSEQRDRGNLQSDRSRQGRHS
jgi:hypothetical protein